MANGKYGKVPYKCDPEKNTKCPKDSCYINGGPCSLTHHKKYAKEIKEQHESKAD